MKTHPPDYSEIVIKGVYSKYVSDHIISGRRLALYNIPFLLGEDKGTLSVLPVFPCIEQLISLAKTYPLSSEFVWKRKKKKWKINRSL